MTLNLSMRPRVKSDTYVIDDGDGAVYLQNNERSYRLEGATIGRWIEKLLPMFTGVHTLGELTDELPIPYRTRVFDIASVLYENGYIQDVSLDLPHHLSDQVQNSCAEQIDFLENVLGSGAYHFELYRSRTVLVIGMDSSIVSLVSALFESGLPKIHLVIPATSVHRPRLEVIVEHARLEDPEADLVEIAMDLTDPNSNDWCRVIRPFDLILYVSQTGGIGELQRIEAACRSEGKIFVPATVVYRTGVVGPVIHPDSDISWESGWRRYHETADNQVAEITEVSSTAMALLTNTLVFELFKFVTGITLPDSVNKFYLLDVENLQGDWHYFLPHPLANISGKSASVRDLDSLLAMPADLQPPGRLFEIFRQLTSPSFGIFHTWDEGGLKQLPLAQCRIQPVDPLANETAQLLPEMICTGMNHEEARIEAGWSGVEAYVSRYAKDESFEIGEFVGVGGGATAVEAVARGLQKCLSEELTQLCSKQSPLRLMAAKCDGIDDERCAYDWQVLNGILGSISIAFGEKIYGFPVVWVKVDDRWCGSVDFTVTTALQKALESVLILLQNGDDRGLHQLHTTRSVIFEDTHFERCTITKVDASQVDILKAAITILQAHGQQLKVVDLALEPFLKEFPAVIGVSLKSEGSV